VAARRAAIGVDGLSVLGDGDGDRVPGQEVVGVIVFLDLGRGDVWDREGDREGHE
jgi:hypothetical protein